MKSEKFYNNARKQTCRQNKIKGKKEISNTIRKKEARKEARNKGIRRDGKRS
jgi:hypothetical protein